MPWLAADLADPEAPARLVAAHVARAGGVDALVAVHARSSDQDLATVTAAELDASFAVNTRATVLLVQAAAAAGVRRVVLFTTGVHQRPDAERDPVRRLQGRDPGRHGDARRRARAIRRDGELREPGPERHRLGRRRDPRRGRRGDAARRRAGARRPTPPSLVAFLVSDAAQWITGQTIDSDGGWGVRS